MITKHSAVSVKVFTFLKQSSAHISLAGFGNTIFWCLVISVKKDLMSLPVLKEVWRHGCYELGLFFPACFQPLEKNSYFREGRFLPMSFSANLTICHSLFSSLLVAEQSHTVIDSMIAVQNELAASVVTSTSSAYSAMLVCRCSQCWLPTSSPERQLLTENSGL